MKIHNEVLQKNLFLSAPMDLMQDSVTVSTDTRTYAGQECFVALRGEKFDAADIVEQLTKLQAKFLVIEKNQRNERAFAGKICHAKIIWVSDSKRFIKTLARDHLLRWKKLTAGKILAVTGTNGKTTTKEALTSLLEAVSPSTVTGTKGNLNNEFGVAYTALEVQDGHRIAIFEIGTNNPGEIEDLCQIIMPDAGIITNIGDGHLERLINREGVYQEKTALFRHVSWNECACGPLVIDGDDEKLKRLELLPKVVAVGAQCKFHYEKSRPSQVEIVYSGKKLTLESANFIGVYNFKNIAMAFNLAAHLFPEKLNQLVSACRSLRPYKLRSQLIERKEQLIFFDGYNANPSSMDHAIEAFADLNKARNISMANALFVIGQMNELGETSDAKHQDLAKKLLSQGAKHVLLVGPKTKVMLDFLGTSAEYFESSDNLKKVWAERCKDAKSIFMKGSRTVYLERLIE